MLGVRSFFGRLSKLQLIIKYKKMSKLELKEINNYFTHRLEVISNERKPNEKCLIVQINLGVDQDLVLLQGYNEEFDFFEDKLEKIKPILRPKEDLYKEVEIGGKKLIPIMVLFGGENYKEYDFTVIVVEKPILGNYIEISVKDLGSPCISFGLKNPMNNMLNFQNWDLLFQWHFDLLGLITKGLAVDINTLSVE